MRPRKSGAVVLAAITLACSGDSDNGGTGPPVDVANLAERGDATRQLVVGCILLVGHHTGPVRTCPVTLTQTTTATGFGDVAHQHPTRFEGHVDALEKLTECVQAMPFVRYVVQALPQ